MRSLQYYFALSALRTFHLRYLGRWPRLSHFAPLALESGAPRANCPRGSDLIRLRHECSWRTNRATRAVGTRDPSQQSRNSSRPAITQFSSFAIGTSRAIDLSVQEPA